MTNPYIFVLGTTQDGGVPHANCQKNCCKDAFKNLKYSKFVSSIAIVDPINKQQWIVDSSPDFKHQFFNLQKKTDINNLDGILLTHAHIGHYLGLAQLGQEVMDVKKIDIYAMPRMLNFLQNNGPWDQLIQNENILAIQLENNAKIKLNNNISITPLLVPHRDDYSETVCFIIESNNKKLIYVPDIDKWEDWNWDINQIITEVDYALIDGTFYDENELERDMSQIPHPFVVESINRFKSLEKKDRNKIFFTHLNHTNPLLKPNSFESIDVVKKNFNIASENLILNL